MNCWQTLKRTATTNSKPNSPAIRPPPTPQTRLDSQVDATHTHQHPSDSSIGLPPVSGVNISQSTTKAPCKPSDQLRRPRRRPSKIHKFQRPGTQLPLVPENLLEVQPSLPRDSTEELYARSSRLDGTKPEIGPQNMAASANASFGDARRNLTSPRPRGRENTKNIPCRNITIYGNCRYENEGCVFNHDRNAFGASAPANTATASTLVPDPNSHVRLQPLQTNLPYNRGRSRFNADSPSFTPAQTTPNGAEAARSTTISPKSANAAVFTPKTNKSSVPTFPMALWHLGHANHRKGPSASTLQPREPQEFKPRNQNEVQDFSAQSVDQSQIYAQHDLSAVTSMMGGYDPFTNAMQGMTNSQQQTSLNPYTQDLSSLAATSGFYNPATDFQQPVGSPISQLRLNPIFPFSLGPIVRIYFHFGLHPSTIALGYAPHSHALLKPFYPNLTPAMSIRLSYDANKLKAKIQR